MFVRIVILASIYFSLFILFIVACGVICAPVIIAGVRYKMDAPLKN